MRLGRRWRRPRKGAAFKTNRRYLALEFALLCIALPVLTAVFMRGRPFFIVLWLAATVCAIILHSDREFRALPRVTPAEFMPEFRRVMVRFVAIAVPLTVAVALWARDIFLFLPRNLPSLWCMILVFYPLVSVYPQGIIYRAFVFRRYLDFERGR